ncbi:MAG TPA: NAD(P)-binding domain-containing protein, partial [Thermomicrobiales bacterium]|nr:NAD(P)-binding domain-containing protein [Thermomicrobiales bacterium]
GERIFQASAVIDASGTWNQPNPMGGNGLPVEGEAHHAAHIRHGVPDIAGAERDRYLGKRTLVIGSGHSALNSLEALASLREDDPDTRVLWALRRDGWDEATCEDEVLTERTLLRREVWTLIASDEIETHTGVRIAGVEACDEGLVARTRTGQLPPVDEFIVATGFRPDWSLTRELRLDLHPVFECPYALAEIIDPAVAACGTVVPHGVTRLAHPETDFYIVGMKSYGRAPTFLLLTGYEQVRSVVCAICGDEAALEVRLELPKRGLCSACTAYLDEQAALQSGGCACDPDDASSDDAMCCDDSLVSAAI